MEKVILFLLLFLLIPFVSAQVIQINEVMPNPQIANAEWVEIYSSEIINLTGWKLDTQSQAFTFNNIIIEDYLIITKNNESFFSLWPDVNRSKVIKWGSMGLVNGGETISLSNSTYNVSVITYPSFSSDSKKNSSWAYFLDEWIICTIPTPGLQNYCPSEPEPECYTDEDCDDNEVCQDGTCVYQEPEEEESNLEITDAPEEATFGEIIDVKLNVYRGDTAKYAVYIRIEDDNEKDVSEEAVLHVFTKYIDYKIKIPIQLKLNCNGKYNNDTYFIIVEGLDETTNQEIYLDGKSSLCPDSDESSEKIIEQSEPVILESESQEESEDKITGNIVRTAETEGSTVLKITPYLLSLLCLLIAFYVIKIK